MKALPPPPPLDAVAITVLGKLDGLPGLVSPVRSSIFSALARWHGRITSDPVAEYLALHDRHQLYEILKRHAMPSFRELAQWVRALSAAVHVAQSGTSLTHITLEHDGYPGNESRAISSLLGLDWTRVRGEGAVDVVFEKMVQRFIQLANLHGRRTTGWRSSKPAR